jgi:plasmid stabilization system protein ParE
MPKPWRLTRQAERSLVEIARWTLETFGPRQAEAYEADLIACCAAIAAGEAPSQDCRRLIDPDLPEDLRVMRAGQHFIVSVEMPDLLIVVDVLHSPSDLPRRLAALGPPKEAEQL